VLRHAAWQDDGERTDYAVVQRLRVQYSGRLRTVVVVAGATSLGTLGAAAWVASPDYLNTMQREASRVLGRDNRPEDVELEALIKVKAAVRNPSRPWRGLSHDPEKLFLRCGQHWSLNVLNPEPAAITVVEGPDGSVRGILVDQDEIGFENLRTRDALVALCRLIRPLEQVSAPSQRSVALEELIRNPSVWPTGSPISDDPLKLHDFYHDHVQRHRLGKRIISVSADCLSLKPIVQRRIVP
jgi:hypothetical protein